NAPGTMRVPLGPPRLEAPQRRPEPTIVGSSSGASNGYGNHVEVPMEQPVELQPVAAAMSGVEMMSGPVSSDLMSTHFELMESFLETKEAVMKAFLGGGMAATGRSLEVVESQVGTVLDPPPGASRPAIPLVEGDNNNDNASQPIFTETLQAVFED